MPPSSTPSTEPQRAGGKHHAGEEADHAARYRQLAIVQAEGALSGQMA